MTGVNEVQSCSVVGFSVLADGLALSCWMDIVISECNTSYITEIPRNHHEGIWITGCDYELREVGGMSDPPTNTMRHGFGLTVPSQRQRNAEQEKERVAENVL